MVHLMINTKLKLLPVTLALIPFHSFADAYAIEARGDAMGGVGVVSANYLTAPFYNPALVAIYRKNDDAGMILPSFGITYNDPDQLVDGIDSLSSLITDIEGGVYTTPAELADANAALDSKLTDLNGSQLSADIGGVVAIGIPNQYLGMNVFGKAYAETFVTPAVYSSGATTLDKAQNTTINAVSVAVTEVGLSLAKYQTFLGQHVAVGVSPKLQRIYTYVYEASINSYDITSVADNGTGETMFNLDAGALWFYGPMRVGFSAMNMIGRDIETQTVTSAISGNPDLHYEYAMRPLYKVGIGIVADYATLSVDYDLNEEERYLGFDDNTQMIRVGGEIDVMRQLKLRAGYNKNLAYDGTEGTVTAGLGLSPLGLFEIDLAVSYTNINAKGAYINFLATY
jgi:hypothetical protein